MALYGLDEVERLEALERHALLLKLAFYHQYGSSGESGAKRLEAAQREFLQELERSDRKTVAATEADTVKLALEVRAHRGTNKRVS